MVPAAGIGESAGRVVADLHRAQPVEAVPLRWAGSRQWVCNPTPSPLRSCRGKFEPGGRHDDSFIPLVTKPRQYSSDGLLGQHVPAVPVHDRQQANR